MYRNRKVTIRFTAKEYAQLLALTADTRSYGKSTPSKLVRSLLRKEFDIRKLETSLERAMQSLPEELRRAAGIVSPAKCPTLPIGPAARGARRS